MEWVPIFNFWPSVKLGGSVFQKACFLEVKEYALNTSLKKLIFPSEIVKIDLGMIISYFFYYCCHIISLFYLIYRIIFLFFYFFLNILELRPREARLGNSTSRDKINQEKHIPNSILTISIEHISFLRDVLRAYYFISRKHAFWKIKTLP